METLETHRDKRFIQLTESKEVDNFQINEIGREHFTLLTDLGMISYNNSFKIWLRKFPRPIFIICEKEREILGWVYTEEWEKPARDGEPVFVLRAIEISESMRGKRLGKRLLLIIARETPGYLITKPINPGAKNFFLSNGFIEKDDLERQHIDLQKHPGYLILPPFRKVKLLKDYEDYFD
ncbi:MAG: GNAT family N-acetyltransferase [Thermoplasmata archaeon]